MGPPSFFAYALRPNQLGSTFAKSCRLTILNASVGTSRSASLDFGTVSLIWNQAARIQPRSHCLISPRRNGVRASVGAC
ncbi:hypothetical protein CBM2634_P30042 [Cupriavidus taiwanensis]|uniref:Uncharacterized protein n=1 Tax=Cupriavidus taiwanensis TaxID=164546 RepID=A0A375JB09_9BURK|nr:hypothetical protein CBM2634_P30042 [Cupriavidus taiwanensis]